MLTEKRCADISEDEIEIDYKKKAIRVSYSHRNGGFAVSFFASRPFLRHLMPQMRQHASGVLASGNRIHYTVHEKRRYKAMLLVKFEMAAKTASGCEEDFIENNDQYGPGCGRNFG